MTLPVEMWDIIRKMSGFKGNYIFTGTVSRSWYNHEASRSTSFEEMMRSPSTLKESMKYERGRELITNNAWGYIAQKIKEKNSIEKLGEFLLDRIPWNESSIVLAGAYENINFIRWVMTTNIEWDASAAFSSAALHGNLFFMQSLYREGYTPCGVSSHTAAAGGSIAVLRWLKGLGCDMKDVTQILAEEGHLGALIWANNHGVPCDNLTLDAAAYGGRLNVVIYLVDSELGVPEKSTLESAASGGNISTLLYLARRFPHFFDAAMMDTASRYANLNMI